MKLNSRTTKKLEKMFYSETITNPSITSNEAVTYAFCYCIPRELVEDHKGRIPPNYLQDLVAHLTLLTLVPQKYIKSSLRVRLDTDDMTLDYLFYNTIRISTAYTPPERLKEFAKKEGVEMVRLPISIPV